VVVVEHFDQASDLGSTRLDNGRPERVAEGWVGGDLGEQRSNDRSEVRLRDRPHGIHDSRQQFLACVVRVQNGDVGRRQLGQQLLRQLLL